MIHLSHNASEKRNEATDPWRSPNNHPVGAETQKQTQNCSGIERGSFGSTKQNPKMKKKVEAADQYEGQSRMRQEGNHHTDKIGRG
jgi:hypothetical protein